mmetsp:Transcript_14552/g.20656  ORF Transcript_14552/g.20656 Transcript_14552/m.20656 type:complete len:214 (-) Transcript_14552:546-1187(-)
METPIAVGTPVTPYPTGVGDSGPPPPNATPLYPTLTPNIATPASNPSAKETPPTHQHQYLLTPVLPATIGGCGKRIHASGRYLLPDRLKVRGCGTNITFDTREMITEGKSTRVVLGGGFPCGCCFCSSVLTLIAASDLAVSTDADSDCCCCCNGITYTRSDERLGRGKGQATEAEGLILVGGSGCGSRVHVIVLDHDQPVPIITRFARGLGLA